MNLKLSFSTQHLILDLFLTVIEGMKRITKCLNYLSKINYDQKTLFLIIQSSNNLASTNNLTWLHLKTFLEQHSISSSREEAINLILIMGGNIDGLQLNQFQSFLQQTGETNSPEVKITFISILHEYLKLERVTHPLKQKVMSRWDYTDQGAYQSIARNQTIDQLKLKQFFMKLKTPVSDFNISLLIKRISSDHSISYAEFINFIYPYEIRVKSAIQAADIQPKIIEGTIKTFIKTIKFNQSYLDKYRIFKSRETSPNNSDRKQKQPIQYVRNRIKTDWNEEIDYKSTPSFSPSHLIQEQINQNKQENNNKTQKIRYCNNSIIKEFAIFIIQTSKLAKQNAEILQLLDQTTILFAEKIPEDNWQEVWILQRVQTKCVNKQDFFEFINQFDDETKIQRTADKLKPQIIFDRMAKYRILLRKLKEQIFEKKECSFIVLFEYLIKDSKQFLTFNELITTVQEVLNLDKNNEEFQSLIYLRKMFDEKFINFQYFLNFMT